MASLILVEGSSRSIPKELLPPIDRCISQIKRSAWSRNVVMGTRRSLSLGQRKFWSYGKTRWRAVTGSSRMQRTIDARQQLLLVCVWVSVSGDKATVNNTYKLFSLTEREIKKRKGSKIHRIHHTWVTSIHLNECSWRSCHFKKPQKSSRCIFFLMDINTRISRNELRRFSEEKTLKLFLSSSFFFNQSFCFHCFDNDEFLFEFSSLRNR